MPALSELEEGVGKFSKFMEWMQSDGVLAERSKLAIPSKSTGAVTPDKSAVMFKVFIADKDGTMDFASVKTPSMQLTYDECIESI